MPEHLAARFLGEVLAAALGVAAATLSLRDPCVFGADERHCDLDGRLFGYCDSLELYRQFGDFQELKTLPLPRPLQLLLMKTSPWRNYLAALAAGFAAV
jgi:hypothetical protein